MKRFACGDVVPGCNAGLPAEHEDPDSRLRAGTAEASGLTEPEPLQFLSEPA